MYDLTMYNVQWIVKIGCKGTKKIPHVQVFVGFFCYLSVVFNDLYRRDIQADGKPLLHAGEIFVG